MFQEDFKDFTLELFKQVQPGTRIGIRNYLVKRGVYITIYSRRVTILEWLFKVI